MEALNCQNYTEGLNDPTYLQPAISVFNVIIPFLVVYTGVLYVIYRQITTQNCCSTSASPPTNLQSTQTTPEGVEPTFEPEELVVFGMTGRKRSGKDTSGERLVRDHGLVRIAFADALKEACIDIFGFTEEQVYGDDLKEVVDEYWGYSPREVLQKVGTELFREAISQEHVLPDIGKNIWVRTIERKILNLAKQGHRRFVITDVRFPNELAFLKESQFTAYSIKVIRQAVMDETDPTKLHASEAAIDSFECDFDINNDSTIEELYTAIDQIVRMTDKNVMLDSGFQEDTE